MIYSDAELLNEVTSFIDFFGLKERIKLRANVPNDQMNQWYSGADYFIAASHYESGGTALCEAMACGCVPIVTGIASFEKVTNGGQCGYLFPPNDSSALLNILYSLNDIQRQTKSRSAIEQFNKELSYEAIGIGLRHIIGEVMNKDS